MIVTVSGADFAVEYDEPDQNADGSPLQDLAKTTIYYDIGAGPVSALDVPATAPTGGGHISTRINIVLPGGQEQDVPVWATAWDLSGNESKKSIAVTIRIDTLAPAAPK